MELAEKNFDRLIRKIRRVAAKDMCAIRKGKDCYGRTGFMVINSYYNRIDAGENYTMDIFDLAKMFEVDVTPYLMEGSNCEG